MLPYPAMVAAAPLPEAPPLPVRPLGDERAFLSGVPWDTYVALREADDRPGCRMIRVIAALVRGPDQLEPVMAYRLAASPEPSVTAGY